MSELEDLEVLASRAVDDIEFFAEVLIGEPLWPHQMELARSLARFRSVNAGRQVGKTRVLAVVALHAAFSRPDYQVLVISAGDDAAKGLLSEVAGLAASPLLAGSVLDENLSQLVLSNGSVIRSVPASQRRARGKSIDLLILDEAAFIDEELWNAAKFTMLARPGSRVVMASTPYGRRDKFFAVQWRRGMDAPEGDAMHAGWHWPSDVSPLVDKDLLEEWRRTDPPRVFRREVLAEWVDEAGAYFTSEELDTAVPPDLELVPPEAANGASVVGGIDWGFAMDANALVLVGVHGEATAARVDGRPVYFVPWLLERYSTPYSTFADEVVEVARGYQLVALVSELNGPGTAPTQMLAQRLPADAAAGLVGVNTTARSKENSFGQLKLLLQEGRFLLPPHPELRKQLSALEFETLESGTVRIAVPERAGHDDVAMALAQAMTVVLECEMPPVFEGIVSMEEMLGEDVRVTIGPDV